MPNTDTMKATLQAYIDRFNAGDLEGVLKLYAENASIEDPVGTPIQQGQAALRTFYAGAIATNAKLELVAPIRGSQGNAAAMAFEVRMNLPEGAVTVRVIDVMTFDDAGKILSMRAFWGPDDYIPG